MARPSKHGKYKPTVERLVNEGLSYTEIQKQFPNIPNATLHGWVKAFEEKIAARSVGGVPNNSESISQARARLLKVDPEDPLQRVINALWDVAEKPAEKGASVAVQAYNAILKGIAMQYDIQSKTKEEADETPASPARINIVANGEA